MNHKLVRKTTLYVVFVYIIMFSTVTVEIANRIGLAMVACFGVFYFWLNGLKIRKTSFFISMFLYGLVIFFAKEYSTAPADKLSTMFNGYISMFIVIFVINLVVVDEEDIKFLLKAFALAALIQCIYMLSVYGLDIFYVIAEGEERIRVGDEVSNSNSVGMSFICSEIISVYFLLNEKMQIHKKLFYVVLTVIGFVFGLLSGSRKALILLIAGSFIILYYKNLDKKNVVKTMFGILIASAAVYAMYYLITSNQMFSIINDRFTTLIEGVRGETILDNSSEERFNMIKTGWEVFVESPVYGKGLYASYNYFETYSHNNFIEILMNTGIIGFIIFYYPYIKGLYKFSKINKKEKMYSVMLVFFLWIFLGGFGMVTYYSKDSMSLMALVYLWLSIKEQKYEKVT